MLVKPMHEATQELATRPVWGVQALLLAAADSLAARFGALAVQGEISGFTRAASGHCYFTLKDAEGSPALLRCAMFRRAAALLDFDARDNQQVQVRGRLAVYEPRGELQLVVEHMRRLGAGSLYEEFLRLKARLEAAGLFDPSRRKPLPREPRCIGVITSATGAALQDVLVALARRAPHVPVVVYPSPVQGAEAPAALVAAMQAANQRRDADVLLLVRGGGSLEDLWAFNDERVVRAVAASDLPLVCGVGHETDVTLCDLAADLRAPTPTAAAELAAPSREALMQGLAAQARRAAGALQQRVQHHAQRLDRAASRLATPAAALAREQQRLHSLSVRVRQAWPHWAPRQRERQRMWAERMSRAVGHHLQHLGQEHQRWRERLAALNPEQVLQRGYAWVEGPDGRPVLSVRALALGESITAVWHDGRAQATVQQLHPEAKPSDPMERAKPTR